MSVARTQHSPSVATGTAHVLALSIARYLLGFVSSAIVTRALGPAGRGAYYLPILAAATATTIGKLGIDQANVFLYGTSGISEQRLAAQNGLIAFGCGVFLGALMPLLPVIAPGTFGETSLLWLLIAAATIPIGLHSLLAGSLFALVGRVRRQYVAAVAGGVVQVVMAVVLFVSGRMTVTAALVLALTGSFVTWAVIAAPLLADPAAWIRWDWPLLKTTLRSALVLHLGMTLFFLHLRVDMFMVDAWLGAAPLGQYSIAVTLAETLMLAADAVAVAVLPGQMTNTVADAAARALRAARVNALLGVALAVTAAVVSGPAIRLVYGAAYDPAVWPMIILLPGVVFMGMQRVCGAPALRAGRPERFAAIYGSTLALNIVLNVFWIPRYGITGASFASTVSYAVGSMMFLLWTTRIARMPLSQAVRFDAADRAAAFDAARSMVALARGLISPAREPL
ncbi:MAG TPA: polysaccharide biosynthesis C-terminal domain-containing protein [Vicinamibacterales bacterium]|jgi:stage V sporulation protein B|nr:polysaccharide biosynthesis C-terminal domain-containing protein [Vicinamibacterales bacterium]